jgi:hypothetical protein
MAWSAGKIAFWATEAVLTAVAGHQGLASTPGLRMAAN